VAFTSTERGSIRMYLGWSARFLQFDDALERAMEAVGNDAATEAQIRAHLTEGARVDAAIQAAEARLKASKVGTIELNDGEIETLRDRGRQNVGRMARAFGVEVRGDAYSGALPTNQASAVGMIFGGGGYQQQG
jgi:hypothetical protein